MANRLANESSPYLLQHANNPVDWYPWGTEALQRARDEDKPIFLSIGYAACHWCHVMEHESFEDAEIARQLNEGFICIKVDREERPDLDQIYMLAVQMMTGRGGWPMSVFLTPDQQPFYGGTYWPPRQRMGMPGFEQVLKGVLDAWRARRELAVHQAAELTQRIAEIGQFEPQSELPDQSALISAANQLAGMFDRRYGGFGAAPKFPHAMDLRLLISIAHHRAESALANIVRVTLDRMAAGGIYDHLGGGFARYSVDAQWLVPHFEKMLYDNALLAQAYLDSFLATGNADDARVVRETLDYVLRDMTDDAGGYHSTEDADSEGEEGKFYVWSQAEIEELLGGPAAERFCAVYGVTREGNFEGHNILHLAQPIEQVAALHGWDLDELQAELKSSRSRLLEARGQRVRPGKDDKVIVSWNGLMIDAMARAGAALGEIRYVDSARRCAEFLRERLTTPDGRVGHCWRRGVASMSGFLDDYATLANGLVSLYEATFDEMWIDWAVTLAETMLARFDGQAGGALYYTADDHETLIARTQDLYDSSVPSGNGMAATLLVRLGQLTSRSDFLETARAIVAAARPIIERSPTAAGQTLLALDRLLGPSHEIVLRAAQFDTETRQVADAMRQRYLPRSVVAGRWNDPSMTRSRHLAPLFAGKPNSPRTVTLYVCQNQACTSPAEGADAALERLNEVSAVGR